MNDKKEKKAKKTATEEPTTSRRTFLWKLWLALGGLALLEYALAAADFLRPRRARLRDDGDAIVIAGPIDRFEPDSVAAFPKGKFYLARLEDGGFLALSRECTHLGCTVPWSSHDRAFVCPCHASSFDITGNVLSPPAPRALDLHPVRIENGIVKVDTSKRLKRRSFDPSQVTHA
ncbi:MAG: Rieske (2Fe-2S) protein [Candidatus Krumholzibacteria bacterium]|nr:Rieske (2Fe-2S) protein [Candidatus Krumholzibacteria bacterium]